MPAYSLSSADKLSPKVIFPFLVLHSFLFLGIGYILFAVFPLFALVHAALGIFIYLMFWRASFPHVFRDVMIGSAISVVTGIVLGDFLLDKFFFLYDEAPRGIIPNIYAATVVFYMYFYMRMLRTSLVAGKR